MKKVVAERYETNVLTYGFIFNPNSDNNVKDIFAEIIIQLTIMLISSKKINDFTSKLNIIKSI